MTNRIKEQLKKLLWEKRYNLSDKKFILL
jgi:hypothetical protein